MSMLTPETAAPNQITDPPRSAPKGRFLSNVLANVLNFGVQVLIGLFFTPYLIAKLGWGSYGLIPLTNVLMSYLGLTTLALNSAVGRFLTIALERKEDVYANKLFNTSLWGSVAIVPFILIPGLLLAAHAEHVLRVPEGYEAEARALFACTILVFVLTTLSTPFDVSTYCRRRFDLRNRVTITATLIGRVGVVLLLFTLFSPRLLYVGIGMLVTAGLTMFGAVLNWRTLLPGVRIRPADFDRGALRHLLSTGGWIVVSQLGTVLLLAIDLIVVNRLFGAEVGGQYATVSLWSAYLRTFAGVIGGVFGPSIMILYAQQNITGMMTYIQQATKLLGLIIALPIGLLCGLAQPFLLVWLRQPEAAHLAPLMALITFHLAINLGYQPLHNVSVATNRVRVPGIVQVIAGLANLGLALLLGGPIGWGVYGVATAGAIVLTVRNVVFTPLYAAHILGAPRATFLREVWPILVMTAATSAAGWGLAHYVNLATVPRLLAAGCGLSVPYLVLTWTVVLRPEERRKALGLLRRSSGAAKEAKCS